MAHQFGIVLSPPLRPPLVVDHRLADLLLLLTSLLPHSGDDLGTSVWQRIRVSSVVRMRNIAWLRKLEKAIATI